MSKKHQRFRSKNKVEIAHYRMSDFGSLNCREIPSGSFGLSLLRQPSQKSRTGGFDQVLEGQGRWDIRKLKVVFAGSRFDRGAAD